MIPARTHLGIDTRWSGSPRQLSNGRAEVVLVTRSEMSADAEGLVHGGFLFSLADYAAMLAVNDPLVVLASASVDFERPVAVGDEVVAVAERVGGASRRPEVRCVVRRGEQTVLSATFRCVIPKRHVLTPRPVEAGGES